MIDVEFPNEIKDTTENTQEGLNQILLGRNIDRIITYIQMKMNTAISVNSELSSIRTQVIQMGWFLTVALVLGTGGLNSFLGGIRMPSSSQSASLSSLALSQHPQSEH